MSDHLKITNYEFSVYETQREPQSVITDDMVVALPMKALDDEFVCPICLSLLSSTMTAKECLHRFCADCITRWIARKKECPTCRQCMPSRRSLRPDPEFDAIIANVYPDLTVYDKFQAEMLERIMSTSNTQALATSVEEGMRWQKSRGRGQAESSAVDDASGFSSGDGVVTLAATGAAAAAAAVAVAMSSSAGTAPAGLSAMELDLAPTTATHNSSVLASLKLVLERSPAEAELPVLKSRYLSVPRSTTALHLLHYLADRFAELRPVQFAGCTAQQYSVSVGSMVLPGEVSIAEMVQTSTERLVVHYGRRTEAS